MERRRLRPGHQLQLRSEAVRQLCGQLPITIASSIALALLLAGMLWAHGHHLLLAGWIALVVGNSAWRWTLYRSYQRAGQRYPGSPSSFYRRLLTASVTAGLLWGLSALAFYPDYSLSLQLMHTLILAGVSAGALTALAADRRSALYFMLAALVPLLVHLLITSVATPFNFAVGTMVLLYGAHCITSMFRMNTQITDNIRMHLDAGARERRLQDSEQRFRQLAQHDALTGLLNRHSLQSLLPQALRAAQASGGNIALIYVDIDHFKDVNDLHGHDYGDEILKGIAGRLQQCTGQGDLVVRMGGDEFVVVTTPAVEREPVARLAQRIHARVAEPLDIGGRVISVHASIGIGTFPDQARDASELLKFADIALYRAKAEGRNTHQFFEPAMRQSFQERVQLEADLAIAIKEGQLHCVYQPVVDLASERVISLEALLRWTHPQRGIIPPSIFIPVAENCGLIEAIGQQVLRMVCAQLRAWQDELVPLVPVAVNVSPLQFRQGHVAGQVAAIAAEAGIDTQLIQIEITESALMQHVASRREELQALRDLGVGVSIDDFGVGYSSLSYLKHLPVDCLKIDRSFVRDMVGDERDTALVAAVIGLAHGMNVRVTAEGVETAKQAAQLRLLECDAAQGYLYYRPLAPAECREVLEQLRQNRRRSDEAEDEELPGTQSAAG
jgi:diguanylate cyclase (GGDEF)-like protein